MDILRKHLLREGHLNKPEMMEIVQKAVEIMSKWQNFSRQMKIGIDEKLINGGIEIN
jgi:hypothetical protein